MTTTEIKRCERCDREMANDEDWAHVGNAYDANDELDCDRPRCREICWGQCQPVDWRARARAAEAVLADIRGEIVTLTGHRDARARGGQHVGTGGRLAGAPPSIERVLREWLARIDGATVAPPGPTGDSDAARWRAKVEPLIEAVRAAINDARARRIRGESCDGAPLVNAAIALLATAPKKDPT